MEIIRNGKFIKLTSEEVEKAYREQKHAYQVGDARSQLLAWLSDENYDVCDEDLPEDICTEDNKAFQSSYGITLSSAIDTLSPDCILEMILEQFQADSSCYQDENSAWESAVEKILDKLKDGSVKSFNLHAILIQKPLDEGLTLEEILELLAELHLLPKDEVCPITVTGEGASATGFIRLDAFDELLGYDDTQESTYAKAIREVLDDMGKETEGGIYTFAGVRTKLKY